MAICDVYVGVEGEPFSWQPSDEAYRFLNLPRSVGPSFPSAPGLNSFILFSQVIRRIKDGRYAGAQVEWGGWAAKVSRADILNFVAEFYPPDF